MQKGVKICNSDALFFVFYLVEQFPTYGRLSNFRHLMGGGESVLLHHEGSMIGFQSQLMICRGHIRTSKGAFQIFFVVDGSMAN